MDDLTLNLIVLGVTGLVVIGIFVLTSRAKKQKLARIEALAREKGWQLEIIKERLRNGYEIKGYNWRILATKEARGQSVEPQQSNIHSETVLTSQSLSLPGRNVVFGPRPYKVNLGNFGEMLKEKLLTHVLGASGKGMQEVPVSSAAFNQHFMVLANEAQDAEQLLSPLSEQLLVEFSQKQPVLKLTQSGLELKLQDAYLDKPEDILRLALLGEELLKAR